tara:strand:- start:96109 stop:96681 length:573 start_codon:yes stop_codon:yes gene_type:complete
VPIPASFTDSISTLTIVPTLGVMSPIVVNLLIAGFVAVSVFMILIVLIQRPQGGGLSGAFGSGGGGGGGAGQTAFGTKTGDMLTYATIGIFLLFLGFAIALNFITRPPAPTAPVAPSIVAPVDVPVDAPDDASDTGTTDADSAVDSAIEGAEDAVDSAVDTIEEAGDDVIDDATEAIEEVIPTDIPAGDD